MAVEPGTGWPGDVADRTTPVARTPADVVRLSSNAPTMDRLDARISVCRACPRLVEWREQVARERRASYAGQTYWGRPIAGLGPVTARIAVIGLAPAAHGGNRTGRIFTGDRSGDALFAALHRAGLATKPTSTHADDGQQLVDTRLLAAVRCAPPANKPTTQERDTCRPWLERELAMLSSTLRAVVVLGGFAWTATWPALAAVGWPAPEGRRPVFGHGAQVRLGDVLLIGCYHPSQQNTFTGKLTESMLDAVFTRAVDHVAVAAAAVPGVRR